MSNKEASITVFEATNTKPTPMNSAQGILESNNPFIKIDCQNETTSPKTQKREDETGDSAIDENLFDRSHLQSQIDEFNLG